MATIQEVIDRVQNILPNAFQDANFIGWCGDVDSMLADSLNPTISEVDVELEKDVDEYDLPSGVKFQRIKSVFVDNKPYDKLDVRSPETKGYMLSSSGKIKLYPSPEQSQIMKIVYSTDFTEYTSVDDELIVDRAYEKMYVWYCMAQIKLAHSELEMYDNFIIRYNEMMAAYDWHKKKTGPKVKRDNKIKGVF